MSLADQMQQLVPANVAHKIGRVMVGLRPLCAVCHNARDVSEADFTAVIKHNIVPVTQFPYINVSASSLKTLETESEGVNAASSRNVVFIRQTVDNVQRAWKWRYSEYLQKQVRQRMYNATARRVRANIFVVEKQVQSDTKKRELLKNPTKIEEIQEKKILAEIEPLQLAF